MRPAFNATTANLMAQPRMTALGKTGYVSQLLAKRVTMRAPSPDAIRAICLICAPKPWTRFGYQAPKVSTSRRYLADSERRL